MLRLDKVIKPWREAAALNDHINLYGFWNETTFLTKSGDVGMVLRVSGVDYESLDHAEQEYAVKRLEAALKVFGPSFHVYPAIQPRLLVGSLKERLWRGRIPPAEDLASNHTQQDDQQQTGSDAKSGGEGDSHSARLFTQ